MTTDIVLIPNTQMVIIPEEGKKQLYSRVSDLLSIRNEKRQEFYDELQKLTEKYSDCALTQSLWLT